MGTVSQDVRAGAAPPGAATRRRVLGAAGRLAPVGWALLVAYGQQRPEPAPAPAAQPVKLVYFGLDSPGFLQPQGVKTFTARFPNVTVAETYTAGLAHMEKVQTAVAGGSPLDACWQSTGWATALGAGGVSVVLDDQAPAMEALQWRADIIHRHGLAPRPG